MRLPRSKYNSIDEIKSDINETTWALIIILVMVFIHHDHLDQGCDGLKRFKGC